jgi:glycogen(starch) synthase
VQCFGPNGVYATAVAALARVPLVVSLQGETVMDDHDIFERSAVLRRALSVSLARADLVTGCSRHTLADAEARFGLTPGRGVVVPNGVVVDVAPVVGDGPRQLGFPERPYLLALGRVVEKKGFDLLLRAYAALEPAERTADVVVAGEGPELGTLEALAVRLGIGEHVRFVGRLTREEVATAMSGATAFVMPSRVEPFGIVLLEAWRAGAPVVATRHGGPPDIVTDGVDGVLVDPYDTPAFARALGELLTDDVRRRRIGAAGRGRVGAFDWSLVAARYRDLYADALGRSAPAGAFAP